MRLGVAAVISCYDEITRREYIVLGRRGKDPNRGLFVLPGGGVEEGETLEQAIVREVLEETGLDFTPYYGTFKHPRLIEIVDNIEHRIILVAKGMATKKDLVAASDLYDLQYFTPWEMPHDVSPIIKPILIEDGCSFFKS